MMTRIYHRIDTAANWNDAIGSPGAGKLAKGEIGILTTSIQDGTEVLGYLGISATETPWNQCPVVFYGYAREGIAETIFSTPVVYEQPATTPPSGSTLSWDSSSDRWVVQREVLSLDEYPDADGTVAWDQGDGKFVVGAAVSAVGIDGGSYEA